MAKTVVGRVAEAWIYPVKGMQGVSLPVVTAHSISIVGDRRVAFTEIDGQSKNTVLDTTKFPGLLRYVPRLVDESDPKSAAIMVTTPEGIEYTIDDPSLVKQIAEESGKKLTVLKMGRAAYHSMPVSLMSLDSIREVSKQVGSPVDARVFRQNLYIETVNGGPYTEDTWVGMVLQFGDRPDSAKLLVVKPDVRCATVTYHPETGKSDPAVLKAIVKNHHNTLGMFCTIVGEGTIQVGDAIYVTA